VSGQKRDKKRTLWNKFPDTKKHYYLFGYMDNVLYICSSIILKLSKHGKRIEKQKDFRSS
jgi:hypothetical protein